MKPLVCPLCAGFLCEPTCPNAKNTYQPVTIQDEPTPTGGTFHTQGLPLEDNGGVVFQRCGGGRRVIRKIIK